MGDALSNVPARITRPRAWARTGRATRSDPTFASALAVSGFAFF